VEHHSNHPSPSESAAGAERPIAVEFREVSKAYGDCVSNDRLSFKVYSGSIHALVGENGAGKSTAMKMLYGLVRPSSGEILVHGKVADWRSPSDAIAHGIGMVHQHFMLAGTLGSLDNLLLGAERSFSRPTGVLESFLPIRKTQARERLKLWGDPDQTSKSSANLEKKRFDWDAPVESLAVGIQQRLEILKLLYREAEILILDEPTAVLTPQEVQEFFAELRKLKAQGKTIIVITHKLKEVMAISDRITVLKAGRMTGEADTAQTSPQEIADWMVGRSVNLEVSGQNFPKDQHTQLTASPPVLRVQDLTLNRERHRLEKVSFEVAPGEVLGVAGVEGNGQSELIQAILHPGDRDCLESGGVEILGKKVNTASSAQIRELGVGVIPEDRHHEGLLLDRPAWENFLLGLERSPEWNRSGLLSRTQVKERAYAAMTALDVRPLDIEPLARSFSGGNQQKIIIARELYRKPKLLIAAQPTRGVDVGAIELIHSKILEAKSQGMGVLLISSELDEILALSDRVLVMYQGRVVLSRPRGECTDAEIGLKMGGG
jgi:ABC-type uncharacterized transport system ATPase subunit